LTSTTENYARLLVGMDRLFTEVPRRGVPGSSLIQAPPPRPGPGDIGPPTPLCALRPGPCWLRSWREFFTSRGDLLQPTCVRNSPLGPGPTTPAPRDLYPGPPPMGVPAQLGILRVLSRLPYGRSRRNTRRMAYPLWEVSSWAVASTYAPSPQRGAATVTQSG
jgi:hypothetical protein